MTEMARVVWSEGLFLRPQHFQQFDRYVQESLAARTRGMAANRFGFFDLALDEAQAATGKIAMTKASGYFRDGSAFDVPAAASAPPPLDVTAEAEGKLIYLCTPVERAGAADYSPSRAADDGAPYQITQLKIRDRTDDEAEPVEIAIANRRLMLAVEGQDLSAHQTLAIGRVKAVQASGAVVLDTDFIPPWLDARRNAVLSGFVQEVEGKLMHRAEALATKIGGAARNAAEIADLLILQLANRWLPLFRSMVDRDYIHPEDLHTQLSMLAGEMATFTSKERVCPRFPAYRHQDLQASFAPLMEELRRSLSAVIEQRTYQIDLTAPNQYGIRLATISDRQLLEEAMFVVVAQASMSADRLSLALPDYTKVGSVDRISELVNMALTGIPLERMPAAPRQLPFYPDAAYFRLDTSHAYWDELKATGEMAMHVSGNFPDLDLKLWAVRQG